MHKLIFLTRRGEDWAHKPSLTHPLFTEVSVPSQDSEQSCVLGVSSQDSEQSCVLGVSSQESEQSCVLGVSSQESEQSCV